MTTEAIPHPAESEIRFLDYRLETISRWPPSARKSATIEAISRRLTSIARSALPRPEVEELLHASCRVLDSLFCKGDTDCKPSTVGRAGT